MFVGTITRVKIDRGFGFIEPEHRGDDLFFHCRELRGMDWDETLQGRRVEFDTVVMPDGRIRAKEFGRRRRPKREPGWRRSMPDAARIATRRFEISSG